MYENASSSKNLVGTEEGVQAGVTVRLHLFIE